MDNKSDDNLTTTSELLYKTISGLKNLGGIEACAIASRDGLLISSDMPDGVIPEVFAAMSATMLGAAETATIALDRGLPNRLIVESKDGRLICMGAGPKALIVVMTGDDATLGRVLIKMTKVAEKIKFLI